MEQIAEGLVSLNQADLAAEQLKKEHAELQNNYRLLYEAYERQKSEISKLDSTCQRLKNDVLDRSRQVESFKPGGRAKVSVSIAQAIQLNAKAGRQLSMVIGISFVVRPLGLVIHEATLRWDDYSLRLFMPQRKTETGDWVHVVNILGDNERDFVSYGVFSSLREYLYQTYGKTVEQFGSEKGVQLPSLLWPEHLKGIDHNFVYCLRRADALPFAKQFRLISADYEEERAEVTNAIQASKAANTANDAQLHRPRVIGGYGVLPSAKQITDPYKQNNF